MGYLDREFKAIGGIDGISDAYIKKKELLRNKRKKAASGELRWMFHGGVLPASIEEKAKLLRRNFHQLESLEGNTLDDGDHALKIKSIEDNPVQKGVSKHINFKTQQGENENIIISEITNPQRGEYPMTEFIYNDKLYTSLPYHGDVLNHTFQQHEIIVKGLLVRAIKEGIISENDATLYEYFHIGHDIDEISPNGKDIMSHEKTINQKQGNYENNEYKTMLKQSGKFSNQQINFSNKLFTLLDDKKSFIGGFEKLVYLVTALDAYTIQEKINSGALLSLAVLKNYLKILENKQTPHLKLYNLLGAGQDRTIPLNKIKYARDFFKNNQEQIENIIQEVKENKNHFDQGALQYLYSGLVGSNKKVQDKDTLLKHFDDVIITLQKNLETIKREQDSPVM